MEAKALRSRLPSLFFALLVIVGLLQACSRRMPPQAPCNFVQSPELQRVSWKRHLPIKLYVHNSVPTEAYGAIDRAVEHYNRTLGDGTDVFAVVARGTSGETNAKRDGYSVVYWYSGWDASRSTEQARTTIYWTGSEIFEADVRINAFNFRYNLGEAVPFNDLDLQSIMVHELGHVLGLIHNPTQGSVMNTTLDQRQERRKLGTQDVSSLKCEY